MSLLAWKLILVLSNGAIVLLATAPAMAPATRLCKTFVDSESLRWNEHGRIKIKRTKTKNKKKPVSCKLPTIYLRVACHFIHAETVEEIYRFPFWFLRQTFKAVVARYLAAADNDHRINLGRRNNSRCFFFFFLHTDDHRV